MKMIPTVGCSGAARAYRWPILCAVLLHVGVLFLLIGGLFFPHPIDYSEHTAIIQAQLVSTVLQPAARVMPSKEKSLPPKAQPTVVPKKIVTSAAAPPIAPQKPAAQNQASPVKKIASVTPQPVKPVKPAMTAQAQKKSLEDALLQEELHESAQTKVSKKADAKQEQLMEAQLKAEESAAAPHAAQTQATAAVIDSFKALIVEQIQQNWIVPQQVEHLSCVLEVALAPGGSVLSVKLIQSSGNAALDRSALAAVNKSSPLPVPKDSNEFSAFRHFTLTVRPEDREVAF